MGWFSWLLYTFFGKIPKSITFVGMEYDFENIEIREDSLGRRFQVLVYSRGDYIKRKLELSSYGCVWRTYTCRR